jgi:[acyl-carrier-protein] S-malonyltransferase
MSDELTSMKKIAVVFPGQGSQSLGMLGSLAEVEIVRQTFNEASAVLGYDVWELAQQGPEEKLNQTEFTQPAVLTADIAIWRHWQIHNNLAPRYLAGHSLGEYAALVAAQAMDFTDALRLVARRGRYMQESTADGVGAMAAIVGLDDNKINEICDISRQQNEVLSPANFNSIGQTVIAGHSAAVDRAIALAREQGAKIARHIPVSVASHCDLMLSASLRLADDLTRTPIQSPHIPVIHNVDVAVHTDPAAIRQALIQQLTRPVRWVETVQYLDQQGIESILECGPGKVLTGLNKRISTTFISANVL